MSERPEVLNYHFDFCPMCGASGVIDQATWHAGANNLIPNITHIDCGSCLGSGRVRVPNGFHLQPDFIVRTHTAASTNARIAAVEPEGEVTK